MATLAMVTADLDDLDVFSSTTNITISTNYARTGNKSFSAFGSTSQAVWPFPAQDEFYMRIAIYHLGLQFVQCRFRATDWTQCSVNLGTQQVQAYYRASTTLLGQSIIPYITHSWTVFEIYVKIHNPNGHIIVKRNGQEVLNVTGRTNFDSETVNNLQLSNDTTATNYWDDMLIDNANWPGLGGIEIVKPVSDGHYQEWDSGSYEDVIDDDDGTYLATDAEVAAKHSLILPAALANWKTPAAVGLCTRSGLSGAGSGNLRPFFRKNSTDTPGQEHLIAEGLATLYDFQTEYPDEVGLEVIT